MSTLVMGGVTVDGATLTPSTSFTVSSVGDATNTGVPVGWVPKQIVTTRQVLTAGNQTFTDVQFDCTIDLRSTGNRFTRCFGRGLKDWAGKARPIVYAVDPGCNVGPANIFEDCTFEVQTPDHAADCFIGYNVTFERCNFSRGVDGLGVYIPATVGTDARFRLSDSYIHDLAYFSPDVGGQKDNHTHNDGVQLHGGNNVVIERTTIQALFDPAVGDASKPGVFDATGFVLSGNCNDKVTVPGQPGPVKGRLNGNAIVQFGGPTDDVHLIDCHLSGGVTGLNVVGVAAKNITVSGCVFGVPMYGKNTAIRGADSTAAVVVVSSSTYEDGTPMVGSVGAGRYNQA